MKRFCFTFFGNPAGVYQLYLISNEAKPEVSKHPLPKGLRVESEKYIYFLVRAFFSISKTDVRIYVCVHVWCTWYVFIRT